MTPLNVFLICLKRQCDTVSTQTTRYRYFFREFLEMLITAESLVKILDANTYFLKRYCYI